MATLSTEPFPEGPMRANDALHCIIMSIAIFIDVLYNSTSGLSRKDLSLFLKPATFSGVTSEVVDAQQCFE